MKMEEQGTTNSDDNSRCDAHDGGAVVGRKQQRVGGKITQTRTCEEIIHQKFQQAQDKGEVIELLEEDEEEEGEDDEEREEEEQEGNGEGEGGEAAEGDEDDGLEEEEEHGQPDQRSWCYPVTSGASPIRPPRPFATPLRSPKGKGGGPLWSPKGRGRGGGYQEADDDDDLTLSSPPTHMKPPLLLPAQFFQTSPGMQQQQQQQQQEGLSPMYMRELTFPPSTREPPLLEQGFNSTYHQQHYTYSPLPSSYHGASFYDVEDSGNGFGYACHQHQHQHQQHHQPQNYRYFPPELTGHNTMPRVPLNSDLRIPVLPGGRTMRDPMLPMAFHLHHRDPNLMKNTPPPMLDINPVSRMMQQHMDDSIHGSASAAAAAVRFGRISGSGQGGAMIMMEQRQEEPRRTRTPTPGHQDLVTATATATTDKTMTKNQQDHHHPADPGPGPTPPPASPPLAVLTQEEQQTRVDKIVASFKKKQQVGMQTKTRLKKVFRSRKYCVRCGFLKKDHRVEGEDYVTTGTTTTPTPSAGRKQRPSSSRHPNKQQWTCTRDFCAKCGMLWRHHKDGVMGHLCTNPAPKSTMCPPDKEWYQYKQVPSAIFTTTTTTCYEAAS